MRYTFVKQFDSTDCAAACLAMICLHYRKETSITMLRDMMGTDLKGTNLIGLGKCAETIGFTTQAIRVDKEGFLSDFTLPCIAKASMIISAFQKYIHLLKKSKRLPKKRMHMILFESCQANMLPFLKKPETV